MAKGGVSDVPDRLDWVGVEVLAADAVVRRRFWLMEDEAAAVPAASWVCDPLVERLWLAERFPKRLLETSGVPASWMFSCDCGRGAGAAAADDGVSDVPDRLNWVGV